MQKVERRMQLQEIAKITKEFQEIFAKGQSKKEVQRG